MNITGSPMPIPATLGGFSLNNSHYITLKVGIDSSSAA
jgi:hypothetical protein